MIMIIIMIMVTKVTQGIEALENMTKYARAYTNCASTKGKLQEVKE